MFRDTFLGGSSITGTSTPRSRCRYAITLDTDSCKRQKKMHPSWLVTIKLLLSQESCADEAFSPQVVVETRLPVIRSKIET